MIRVLVIDDSPLARSIVTRMLCEDPEIEVVGAAMNGLFGLRHVYRDHPDVVTLDVEMPQMDGLATLREIMQRRPTPVVMLSAHTEAGARTTLQALELGAVDFVLKPAGRESEVLGALAEELRRKVRAAKAIGEGWRDRRPAPTSPDETQPLTPTPRVGPRRAETHRERTESARRSEGTLHHALKPSTAEALAASRGTSWPPRGALTRPALIAIGASTGGVPGICRILEALPEGSPPVVCVQHMPRPFTGSFAKRLDGHSRLRVSEAAGGEILEPGMALIARGDAHLEVRRSGSRLVAHVRHGERVSGHIPSVDALFESCAQALGGDVAAAILSGMGKDGAAGLLAVRRAGGVTLGEARETCVVYGMPRAAVEVGAVERSLPIEELTAALVELASAPQAAPPAGLTAAREETR